MSKAKKSSASTKNPLSVASGKGDLPAVRKQLASGANVNECSAKQYPPLILAASGGHLEVVLELISARADVNQVAQVSRESTPSSPLISAVKNGHFEVAQALVRAGAKLDLEVFSGHNAAAEAAFKAITCDWRSRNNDDKSAKVSNLGSRAQNREEALLWLQFVRDALKHGVRVRDYCLWEATKLGCEEMALTLIENGADPNVAPHRSAPLEKAISNKLTRVVSALLKAGADPNKREGFTPLLLAVANSDHEITKALLDYGARINETGDMALGAILSTSVNHSDTRKQVDDQVSDPQNAQESTALIIATRKGDHEMVKLLLQRSADSNIGDKHGKTPLTWAIALGFDQISQTLRQSKASEPTYLSGAAPAALMAAASKGDLIETDRLLRTGLNPNVLVEVRKGRRAPIHSAAENGQEPIVRRLLEAGADVNAPCLVDFTVGVTALMLAAEAGHIQVLQTLIAAGADLHAKTQELDGGNETALHYAAHAGSVPAIRILIEAGAKVNAKAKGQITPLQKAVSERHLEAAKTLLAFGADVHIGPNDGSGPLQTAAYEADVPMVRLLLANGALPMPPVKKPYFFPLSAAASQGSVEIVQLLLKAGAEVNAVPIRGGPSLTSAIIFKHEEVIETLLKAGADPNLPDEHGMTSVMLAIRMGHAKILTRLLAAGGDLNRRNKEGKTCLDIARQSGRPSIRDQVRQAGGIAGTDHSPISSPPKTA